MSNSLPPSTTRPLIKPDKNISCQWFLKSNSISYHGFLRKEPEMKARKIFNGIVNSKWDNKFVILSEGRFLIYSSEISVKCEKSLSLHGYKVECDHAHEVAGVPWVFSVGPSDNFTKTFRFSACSLDDRQRWVEHFEKEIQMSNALSSGCGKQSSASTLGHANSEIPPKKSVDGEIPSDDLEYVEVEDDNRFIAPSQSEGGIYDDVKDVKSIAKHPRSSDPGINHNNAPVSRQGFPLQRGSTPLPPRSGSIDQTGSNSERDSLGNNTSNVASDVYDDVRDVKSTVKQGFPHQRGPTPQPPSSGSIDQTGSNSERDSLGNNTSNVASDVYDDVRDVPSKPIRNAHHSADDQNNNNREPRLNSSSLAGSDNNDSNEGLSLNITALTERGSTGGHPKPPIANKPKPGVKPVQKPVTTPESASPLEKRLVPPVPTSPKPEDNRGITNSAPAVVESDMEDIMTDLATKAAFCDGTNNECNQIMTSFKEEGVYMIRNSANNGGLSKTLLVRTCVPNNQIVKYQIVRSQAGQFQLKGTDATVFESLSDLLNYYQHNTLPKRTTMLYKPYTEVMRSS